MRHWEAIGACSTHAAPHIRLSFGQLCPLAVMSMAGCARSAILATPLSRSVVGGLRPVESRGVHWLGLARARQISAAVQESRKWPFVGLVEKPRVCESSTFINSIN